MNDQEYLKWFTENIVAKSSQSKIFYALKLLFEKGALNDDMIAYWVDQIKTATESPNMMFNWCNKLNYSIVMIQNKQSNTLVNDYFFILLYGFINEVYPYFSNLNKMLSNPAAQQIAEVHNTEIELSNELLEFSKRVVKSINHSDIKILEYLRIQCSHPTVSKYKIRLSKNGKQIVKDTDGMASDELREKIHKRLKTDFSNSNIKASQYYVSLIESDFALLMQKINLWHLNQFFTIT